MEVVGQAIGFSLSDLRKDPRRVVGQLVGRLMAVAGVGGDGKEGEGKEVVVEEEKVAGADCSHTCMHTYAYMYAYAFRKLNAYTYMYAYMYAHVCTMYALSIDQLQFLY